MKQNLKRSIIYGLTIWILSSSLFTQTAYSQGSDTAYVSIIRWRAKLAAHDILRKRVQDSLISDQYKQIADLTTRNERQQATINDYAGIALERKEQLSLKDVELYYCDQRVESLKKENRKVKRHRNIAALAAFTMLILLAWK